MMGPVYSCADEAHLDRLLAASRAEAEVRVDGRRIRFRDRGGLVLGSTWQLDIGRPAIHLGYGHPFNPLRWPADRRLLRTIGRTLEANGSARLDRVDLA